MSLTGDELPRLRTAIPGPASRALAARLAVVESRNITRITDNGPIFWSEAHGANVTDADGNVYVDLTAGFSVAATGHANPRVAAAIASQAARLPHGLGDVYPPDVKVRLLERLAAIAPGDLSVAILASAGAEAVEAALKTALLATGRPGILAFTGGYHGLTYGALACTWRPEFREPFRSQLFAGVRFARFPDPFRWEGSGDVCAEALAGVRRHLDEAEPSAAPVGAILIEPVQGRGGLVVPPAGFLAGLREICDERGIVLVMDEIYCGMGRTGRWFACEHWGVTPDILLVGKALSGALPLSAAIGTPAVMAAWPPSTGEAIHTSTFLGNPIACAAALAQLDELEEKGLLARAAELGERLRARLEEWVGRYELAGQARGLGLLQGLELVEPGPERRPAGARALRIADAALRRGVLLLTEGEHLNTLAFTPPLVITDAQLHFALDVIERELAVESRH
ncbi:MAG TPA: aspartate aminotransferase family protein [Longimicrobiales bacterium]|nr:aspartate aminotransferase family protein [Longimicrobiales bacterium]